MHILNDQGDPFVVRPGSWTQASCEEGEKPNCCTTDLTLLAVVVLHIYMKPSVLPRAAMKVDRARSFAFLYGMASSDCWYGCLYVAWGISWGVWSHLNSWICNLSALIMEKGKHYWPPSSVTCLVICPHVSMLLPLTTHQLFLLKGLEPVKTHKSFI